MPCVLSRLFEFADDGLHALSHDARFIRGLGAERGQRIRHPFRRRAGVRECLHERPETQDGGVPDDDESGVFRGRGTGATRGRRGSPDVILGFLRQGIFDQGFGEAIVKSLEIGVAKRDGGAADHAGESRGRAHPDFMLTVLEHVGDTVEQLVPISHGQQEQTTEVYDLHVDHNPKPLMP